MKEELMRQAEVLALALENFPEYKDFLSYKEQVNLNEQLKNQIIAFQKMQIELSIRKEEGNIVSWEEEQALEENFMRIVQFPEGEGYLASQREMMDLLSQVLEAVGGKFAGELDMLNW